MLSLQTNRDAFRDEVQRVKNSLSSQLEQFETFLEGPGASLKPDLDPALVAMKRAFSSNSMEEMQAAQGILNKVISKLASVSEF